MNKNKALMWLELALDESTDCEKITGKSRMECVEVAYDLLSGPNSSVNYGRALAADALLAAKESSRD
jgi:hypothetical protein